MQSGMLEVIHIFIEQRNSSDKEVTTNYPIYKISLGVKANKKIIQNFMLRKFKLPKFDQIHSNAISLSSASHEILCHLRTVNHVYNL